MQRDKVQAVKDETEGKEESSPARVEWHASSTRSSAKSPPPKRTTVSFALDNNMHQDSV